MNRRTSFLLRAAVVVVLGLCATGCDVDQKGMVMLVDNAYRAAVVASNDDGITLPDGILWWQGKLLIADEGASTVRLWSNRSNVRTLCDSKSGIQAPEDLVRDEDGNLYFTDDEAGGVWLVDGNGRASLLAGPDKGLVSTEGIAIAPSGDILVGDGVTHQVFRVSRTGEVSTFLDPAYGITKPESMAFDDSGNLYIADNEDDVLYLLTPEMQLQRVLEERESFSPESICYANHTLYITDSKHGKVSRFTPEDGLETIAVFAGTLSGVAGITTDNRGGIFVSVVSDLHRQIGYIVKLERESLL